MSYEVKIPYRVPTQAQGGAGMNLWITQHLKLVYQQDWSWDHSILYGGYIYKFKDEKHATLFALRWT